MVYVINGDPIPLARARYGLKKVYDPQKNQKLLFGVYLNNQFEDQPLITGPVHLDVTFYMPWSKQTKTEWNNKAKKRVTKDPYHKYRPDLDNLIKFVCDAAARHHLS